MWKGCALDGASDFLGWCSPPTALEVAAIGSNRRGAVRLRFAVRFGRRASVVVESVTDSERGELLLQLYRTATPGSTVATCFPVLTISDP